MLHFYNNEPAGTLSRPKGFAGYMKRVGLGDDTNRQSAPRRLDNVTAGSDCRGSIPPVGNLQGRNVLLSAERLSVRDMSTQISMRREDSPPCPPQAIRAVGRAYVTSAPAPGYAAA